MPHSWHFPIGPVLDRVVRLNPTRVLDIGIGFGKWGFLMREALDWAPGRLERDAWRVTIDGIEVFPYESPIHEWVYDNVIWDDVLNVVDQLQGYDVVLMSDVIEHLEKAPAMALLRTLVKTNRAVIVSTPAEFFEQEIAGNTHEHHVSHWTMADFDEFVFDFEIAGGAALVVTIAGAGATWPTAADKRASTAAYRIPGIRSRYMAALVTKKVVSKVYRS
jgi:hypothetical protein